MRLVDLSICALFVMTVDPIGRGVRVVCVTFRHLDIHAHWQCLAEQGRNIIAKMQ